MRHNPGIFTRGRDAWIDKDPDALRDAIRGNTTMNMKVYSESVGKPPTHEIILRCAEEDRDHPWLLYRTEMYRELYPDRKIVVRTIKRVKRHEPEANQQPTDKGSVVAGSSEGTPAAV